MKSFLVIAISFLVFSISFATELNESSAERIFVACKESAMRNKSKIKNIDRVCKCIGQTHLAYALRDADKKSAREDLQWVVNFYETSDKKKLQALIKKKPLISDFDDQVVAECMDKSSDSVL